jgi:hypothetical protein
VALRKGSLVVNSSQGGGSKDYLGARSGRHTASDAKPTARSLSRVADSRTTGSAR